MLKEIISKIGRQPIVLPDIGGAQVELIDPFNSPFNRLEDHSFNLKDAKEIGIEPLSLKSVVDQLGEKEMENIVLFDTSLGGFGVGNHWVIDSYDVMNKKAKLNLCSSFGYIFPEYKPMVVDLENEIFTGASLQARTKGEEKISLKEFRQGMENGVDFSDTKWNEKIFWSNVDRKLVLTDNHPAFSN